MPYISPPTPSAEVFIMFGIIILCLVVLLSCHLFKRWNKTRAAALQMVEVPHPSDSSVFVITPVLPQDHQDPEGTPEGLCRDISNVSEIYYRCRRMSMINPPDFYHEGSGMTPIMDVSDDEIQELKTNRTDAGKKRRTNWGDSDKTKKTAWNDMEKMKMSYTRGIVKKKKTNQRDANKKKKTTRWSGADKNKRVVSCTNVDKMKKTSRTVGDKKKKTSTSKTDKMKKPVGWSDGGQEKMKWDEAEAKKVSWSSTAYEMNEMDKEERAAGQWSATEKPVSPSGVIVSEENV